MRATAIITAGTLWLSALFLPVSQADTAPNSPVDTMPSHPPLYTVYFGFGADAITRKHRRDLSTLVARSERDNRPLLVTGHTDDIGPTRYNETLALKRAGAVRQVLIEAGIDAARIRTQALAKAQYAASNETPEGRAHNRRAEVHWDDLSGSGRYHDGGSGRTLGASTNLSADEDANGIQVSRYTTLAATPTSAQRDPLSALIDISLPESAWTVGAALYYVLRPSGWRLAAPIASDPAAKQLFALPLPESQRRLGPLSISDAMRVICGASFVVVQDPVHRLASCELTEPFAPWRRAMKSAPSAPTGEAAP